MGRGGPFELQSKMLQPQLLQLSQLRCSRRAKCAVMVAASCCMDKPPQLGEQAQHGDEPAAGAAAQQAASWTIGRVERPLCPAPKRSCQPLECTHCSNHTWQAPFVKPADPCTRDPTCPPLPAQRFRLGSHLQVPQRLHATPHCNVGSLFRQVRQEVRHKTTYHAGLKRQQCVVRLLQ